MQDLPWNRAVKCLEACGVDADHIHLYLPKDAVGKVDLIHIFRRIVGSIDINCITVQVQHVLWARLYEHRSLKKNMRAGWRRERPGQWDRKVMDWQDLWHLFTKESLREKTLSVPLSKTNKRYKDLDLNTKNKNHFSKSQYEQQKAALLGIRVLTDLRRASHTARLALPRAYRHRVVYPVQQFYNKNLQRRSYVLYCMAPYLISRI